MNPKNIAIVTSHPIQYNAPLFAALSEQREINLRVFYTWGESCIYDKFDPDFGKVIKWDIPLLEGYAYHFTLNTSQDPGSHHFFGIVNPKLIQEIEHWNADIVWVWGWCFFSHLRVMRHFYGKVPVWFRGDSTLIDEGRSTWLRKIMRRLTLTIVYSCVNKVFSVGTNNTNYFIKNGVKPHKVILAPHSINNDRFTKNISECKKRAEQWRNELGILEKQFVLLFAGKFEAKKNPQFMIEVLMKVDDPNTVALMIGSGKLEKELKATMENVKFLDFQNQSVMPVVYHLGDLFVLPSLGPGETWGLAMNEALASGIPVAASINCGGAVDLINDKNGFIFKPEEGPEVFIKKLNNFRKMPKQPFQREFLKNFNYQRIIDAVLNELH